MVKRKTHWAVICLLGLYTLSYGQALPKACPIYIAHELHDGEISTVSRQVDNVACSPGSHSWTDLQNLRASDQQYAEVVFPVTEWAECISLTDLQLNVPPGAQIHGFQADFYGHSEGSAPITVRTTLVGDNRQRYGRNQAAWALGDDWPAGQPGNDGQWTYGGPTNTWGANLTADMVNSPDFGIECQVRKPIMGDTTTVRLDQVRFTIYYTPLFTICHDSCTIFYVDTVPGALAYHWTLPPKASFLSKEMNSNIVTLNVMDMNYGLHDICVQTISAQGISDFCCMRFRLAECGKGSIGDYVWFDENQNGLQDTSENGLEGIPIELYEITSGHLIQRDTTDQNGLYQFNNIPEGHYYLQLELGSGYQPVPFLAGAVDTDSDLDQSNGPWTTRTFYLSSGQDDHSIDIGLFVQNQIGNRIWADVNANGIQDVGEQGIKDIQVVLLDSTGQPVDTQITDQNGLYSFGGVSAGDYQIQVDVPAVCYVTSQNVGINENLDSDIDPQGLSTVISIGAQQVIDNLDGGLVPFGRWEGVIWYDRLFDGTRSTNEPRVAGVEVQLWQAGNIYEQTQTDSLGRYAFDSLLFGDFEILILRDTSFVFSPQDVGNDNTDSDVDQDGEVTAQILGKDTVRMDAGYKLDCKAEAPEMAFLQGIPCYDNTSFLVNFQDSTVAAVPPGYDLMYLLVDATTGAIIAGSNVPVFSISSVGSYEIYSWVYQPNPANLEYLNLSDFVVRGDNHSALVDARDQDFLCGSVAGPLSFVVVPCAQITGRVFYDQNDNGVQDSLDLDEEGIQVQLLDQGGNRLIMDTTDKSGEYTFQNLAPGFYFVEMVNPSGQVWTIQNMGGDDSIDSDVDDTGRSELIDLTTGGSFDIDGGLTVECSAMADPMGTASQSEDCFAGRSIVISALQGVSNVPGGYSLIYLLIDEASQVIMDLSSVPEFTVDGEGTYRIQSLVWSNDPNDHEYFDINRITLGVTLVDQLEQWLTDESLCHDYNRIGRRIEINECGQINGLVWVDNGDGIRQPGEPFLDQVQVRLLASGNMVMATRQTNEDGYYAFDELPRGLYTIEFESLPEKQFTVKDAGMDDTVDSDVDDVGFSDILILNWGQMVSVDAGYVETGSTVGDYVWNEIAFNGIQDFFESGRNDVPVLLRNTAGQKVDSTITANDSLGNPGYYCFTGVQEGTYYLEFDIGADLSPTTPNQGADDELDSDVDDTFGPGTTDTFFIKQGDQIKNMDLGLIEKCAVGNRVWCDENANGIQDVDEPGINGVRVYLYDQLATLLDSTLTANLPGTSESGYYGFDNLLPGAYYLVFGNVTDKVQTQANVGLDPTLDSDVDNSNGFGSTPVFNLSPGEKDETLDAGYVDPGLLPSQIGDYVWVDRDNDGIQDVWESGLNGVRVELYDENDQMIRSTTSDYHPQFFSPGYYMFDSLQGGQYYVVFVAPLGYEYTASFAGFDDEKDSDISNVKTRGSSNIFGLTAGESKMGIDAGFVQFGSLGDYVWEDANANGVQDPWEVGLNDVTVTLKNRNRQEIAVATTKNDASGNPGYYVFEDIDPDGYYLEVDLPVGFAFTPANEGGDDTKDSDIDNSNGFGTSSIINISPGEHDRDADVGMHMQGALGRLAWLDTDYDGIKDDHEKGMADISVYMYNHLDSMYDQTRTDHLGQYRFDRIPKGSYYLKFDIPSGYDFSMSGRGKESQDCDVTHRFGYGTTDLMEIYPGMDYQILDAGITYLSVLSLELKSFEVSKDGHTAHIKWEMHSEHQMDQYIIERQKPGIKDFEAISIQVPQTSAQGIYSLEDPLEAPGIYTYRLRMVQKNGATSESEIRSVALEGDDQTFKWYPNPVSDWLYLENATVDAKVNGSIRDLHGRVVYDFNTVGDVQKIDVRQWPEGLYLLEVSIGGGALIRDKIQVIRAR